MYAEQKKRAVLKARGCGEVIADDDAKCGESSKSENNDTARMSRDGRTEGGNAKYAVQGT